MANESLPSTSRATQDDEALNLREERIQQLADLIAARMPPRQVEVALSTGEALSAEAMVLARFYDGGSEAQRAALASIMHAFSASGG